MFHALGNLFLGPDAGLHLADVCLLQQIHAQSRLTDTSADGERHVSANERFVEIEVQTVGATAYFELLAQGFFVDADTHRRYFKRALQYAVPQDDVAVEAVIPVSGARPS